MAGVEAWAHLPEKEDRTWSVRNDFRRITLLAEFSQGILAPCAHEAAVLLALEAGAVEEPLADRGVVAIAHRVDHVPAIIAQVLDRFLPCHVALVRHQDREDEDEGADDQADHPTLEAHFILKRQGGPGEGHAPR